MSPFAWAGDKFQDFLITAFNFAGEHPAITGVIIGWQIFCFLTVCFIRGIYPSSKWKRDDRPVVARVLLLICDPFVGNVWSILEWLFGKLGIKLPTPPPMQDFYSSMPIQGK